jgi:2-oxoglutarate ferredoxin oxidoreductase subunit gamma
VLNLPSLDKYEPLVVPGGVLIANSSLINRDFQRKDLEAVMIPANEIAEAIGDKRLINMVVLGAMLGKLPVLPLETIENALKDHLPERHRRLLPLNYEALRQGMAFAQKTPTSDPQGK